MAVAEMGDRLATINMGRKWGVAVVPLSVGSWVPIEHNVALLFIRRATFHRIFVLLTYLLQWNFKPGPPGTRG